MERIVNIASQIPLQLHSDFRWALKLKQRTAKDVIAELVQDYVRHIKLQVSNNLLDGR